MRSAIFELHNESPPVTAEIQWENDAAHHEEGQL